MEVVTGKGSTSSLGSGRCSVAYEGYLLLRSNAITCSAIAKHWDEFSDPASVYARDPRDCVSWAAFLDLVGDLRSRLL